MDLDAFFSQMDETFEEPPPENPLSLAGLNTALIHSKDNTFLEAVVHENLRFLAGHLHRERMEGKDVDLEFRRVTEAFQTVKDVPIQQLVSEFRSEHPWPSLHTTLNAPQTPHDSLKARLLLEKAERLMISENEATYFHGQVLFELHQRELGLGVHPQVEIILEDQLLGLIEYVKHAKVRQPIETPAPIAPSLAPHSKEQMEEIKFYLADEVATWSAFEAWITADPKNQHRFAQLPEVQKRLQLITSRFDWIKDEHLKYEHDFRTKIAPSHYSDGRVVFTKFSRLVESRGELLEFIRGPMRTFNVLSKLHHAEISTSPLWPDFLKQNYEAATPKMPDQPTLQHLKERLSIEALVREDFSEFLGLVCDVLGEKIIPYVPKDKIKFDETNLALWCQSLESKNRKWIDEFKREPITREMESPKSEDDLDREETFEFLPNRQDFLNKLNNPQERSFSLRLEKDGGICCSRYQQFSKALGFLIYINPGHSESLYTGLEESQLKTVIIRQGEVDRDSLLRALDRPTKNKLMMRQENDFPLSDLIFSQPMSNILPYMSTLVEGALLELDAAKLAPQGDYKRYLLAILPPLEGDTEPRVQMVGRILAVTPL